MSDEIRIAPPVVPLESTITKTQSNTEAGRDPKDRRPPKRKSRMDSDLQNGSTNEEHKLDVLI